MLEQKVHLYFSFHRMLCISLNSQHHKHRKLCMIAPQGLGHNHFSKFLSLQPLTPSSLLLWKVRTLCRSHWTIQIIIVVIMEAPAACQVPFHLKLLKHYWVSRASQRPNGQNQPALLIVLCYCVRVGTTELRLRWHRGWMLRTLTALLTRLKHNWYHSCCQITSVREEAMNQHQLARFCIQFAYS